MKSFLSGLIVSFPLVVVPAYGSDQPYAGSSFSQVWHQVSTYGVYQEGHYPTFKAGFRDLVNFSVENIGRSAKRTLADRRDLLPNFQKLVHANGICMAGKWSIDQENEYTGYFAKGAEGKIIVRISEAAGNPNAGDYRAFGVAGKIFPTTNEGAVVKTANFQVIDDLGGTLAKHFTDVALKNKPELTRNTSLGKTLHLALATAIKFRLADSHIGERQLYEISELGLKDPTSAHTPRWMLLRASAGTRTSNAKDFRDELRLADRGGSLSMDILVASEGDTSWQKIGQIVLDDDVVSVACDHNLHFHHPVWRKDVK